MGYDTMSERVYKTRITVENYVKVDGYEEVFRSQSCDIALNENIFGAISNIISLGLDLSVANDYIKEMKEATKEKTNVVYCKKVNK